MGFNGWRFHQEVSKTLRRTRERNYRIGFFYNDSKQIFIRIRASTSVLFWVRSSKHLRGGWESLDQQRVDSRVMVAFAMLAAIRRNANTPTPPKALADAARSQVKRHGSMQFSRRRSGPFLPRAERHVDQELPGSQRADTCASAESHAAWRSQAPHASRLCRLYCRRGAGCRCDRNQILSALPRLAPSQSRSFRCKWAAMKAGCRESQQPL